MGDVQGMQRDLATRKPAKIIELIFSAAAPGATYYVVDPPSAFMTGLGAGMDAAEGLPEVRLLSARPPLRELRQDFLAASKAANHVEDGSLRIRERTRPDGEPIRRTETPLILGEGAIHAPLSLGDGRGSRLSGRGGTFQREARERCDRLWEESQEFQLRAPARDRVAETLEAEMGRQFREDFEESLTQASSMRNPAEFEEVTAALIVAGKHEVLHYELSRWGERIGLASKATFSRRKSRLEDMDVLETEPVETGVGRPRQRLVLADKYADLLEGHSIGKLVNKITA